MPNGHGQRQADEVNLIEQITSGEWQHDTDPPEWVLEAAESDDIHLGSGFTAPETHYYGDYHVYKARSSVHGSDIHVFFQVRDRHLPTDNESGKCGNCGRYVERQDTDRFLQCGRCGWTIGFPILRHLRY